MTAQSSSPIRDLVIIVVTGVVLGVGYNYLGHQSGRPWGVAWIGEDRNEQIVKLGEFPGDAGEHQGASNGIPAVVSSDPLAPPPQAAAPAAANLPEIPSLGRPVEVSLAWVKAYAAADAALIVDARSPEEFAEGRIPGSVCLPADEVVTDPVRLEALDTGGRPVIVYCGGGACEASKNVAWELIGVGHEPVAVYEGGFPEWVEDGNAVETGTR